MRQAFAASLCKNGILGGGLFLEEGQVTYRTGKVTVSPRLRNLSLPYSQITGIERGWLLCFPTVVFQMKNGEVWKFIVFARNAFCNALKERMTVN